MKKIAFTLVLNGMPFIRQQAEIIPKVFDHWYIIEGYALPVKDTAWCRNINITKFTNDGLSNDGTTEFLDTLPDNVTVIRKERGSFWNGKTEMCNSFMSEVSDSILMEFDVDEIWNPDILKDVLDYAEKSDAHGMVFKCNYYVGNDLILEGENCYGNNPGEWMRLWKIGHPTQFISHEPPRVRGLTSFLDRSFTSQRGWIFDHYAYVNENQLKFKEDYYGYKGAVNNWKMLQQVNDFPVNLKDYFPWVNDYSKVIKIK
jgi:hypothetical protein